MRCEWNSKSRSAGLDHPDQARRDRHAIHTARQKSARSDEPTHTPPVYDPELVAEAILYAAENPVRDLMVGGGAKLMSAMGRYAPRMADKYMERV